LRHSLTKRVPYTPAQLFALVGDVDRYPQFVPWVTRLRSWDRRPDGEGITLLDAEAEVRFSIVHERFATRVRLDEPACRVEVSLIDGPFRHLENRWSFTPAQGGADLLFEIDFEFKSRFLDAILRANFERAVRRLVECFEARARQLYGA
jgi:coenzyme Q-binding protein COQ10